MLTDSVSNKLSLMHSQKMVEPRGSSFLVAKDINVTESTNHVASRANDFDVVSLYNEEDGFLRTPSGSRGRDAQNQVGMVAASNENSNICIRSTDCEDKKTTADAKTSDCRTNAEKLSISSCGLPVSVVDKYRSKGIWTLFPWQKDCLDTPDVLDGRNIVYSAPTSAGKTLVAEILALRRVLSLKKKAIFILPFISVAKEKTAYLQEIYGSANVKVAGFWGTNHPAGGFKMVDVAICTIEKANSLINRLLLDNSINKVGSVVVDELHLLGDNERGHILELLLTKLKFINRQNFDEARGDYLVDIQIIGMSATLPNLGVLAEWLDAALILSDYRPIPLAEKLCFEGALYSPEMKVERVLDLENSWAMHKRNEPVIFLTVETVTGGNSVLIFCPTRRWCESLAEEIAQVFFSIGRKDTSFPLELADALRCQFVTSKIASVLSQLRQLSIDGDSKLIPTVGCGVAYHHAGMTVQERELIESAFRNNIVRVICATSTLSAGVNLPARRVLLVSPVLGKVPLDQLTYKQMCGRAGRKGVDTEGESILLCDRDNLEIGRNLLASVASPVQSAILSGKRQERLSSHLKRSILEIVASGIALSESDVICWARGTFGFLCFLDCGGETKLFESLVRDCLVVLSTNDYIKASVYDGDELTYYYPTQLGSACMSACLSPEEGLSIFKELDKARHNFVLASDLHVIYLITPCYMMKQWGDVNWIHFLSIYDMLSKENQIVGSLVGINRQFMTDAITGAVASGDNVLLFVHLRFFISLALSDLVNEVPMSTICRKYDVEKGKIQALQQAASTYAGMITTFCGKLGWRNLELLLSQFQDRLQFAVQRDLCDLIRLPILTASLARALYNSGYETIADLAVADPVHIEGIINRLNPFRSVVHSNDEPSGIYLQGQPEALEGYDAASSIVSSAVMFIKEAVLILNEPQQSQ